MRSICLFVFVSFWCAIAYPQAERLFYDNKLKTDIIALEKMEYGGIEKFFFRSINVIDARSDTGKLGYWNPTFKGDVKINFQNGSADGLRNFLTTYYSKCFKDTSYAVLMVIRKLWMTQYDTIVHRDEVNGAIGQRIHTVKLKLEFYLNNGDFYYPVFRTDTFWRPAQPYKKNIIDQVLTEGVIDACNRLFSIDPDHIFKKQKKLKFSEVEQFNRKINDLPILSAVQYKKGIFSTFLEFCNNKPSRDFLEISKGKFGDVLYVNDEKGNVYPTNNFWGYSDGKDIFICSGRNFFKLIRSQNTFEFFGIVNLYERFNLRNPYSSPMSDGILGSNGFKHKQKPKLRMFPYQIDMETGEVY